MNKSEKYVSHLCTKSFLSLWSYNNPIGKRRDKELCDVLVVCEPDIIIFSVKDINLTNSGNEDVSGKRWIRSAITESVKQIKGAERRINSSTNVITKEEKIGLPFPDISNRRIHRVAVAFGSKGKIPIVSKDFGNGFVHVFDEISLTIIMKELDTISDFVQYLIDKESFCKETEGIILNGGEKNLLALYLQNGRDFSFNADQIIVVDNLWNDFVNQIEYQSKEEEDASSYAWDNLIDIFCKDYLNENLELGQSLNNVEKVTRTMALENRFNRRILANRFSEFMKLASNNEIRSRYFTSPSGMCYVFLACPHGEDRKERISELFLRCFVARGLNLDCTSVVGIATERYEKNNGFSLDAIYLDNDNWMPEDQNKFYEIQNEFGFFTTPMISQIHENEYPNK